jgi:hypothetical protein
MVRLAAILSLFLSLVFEGWKVSHGAFGWQLFLILGLLLWCVSEGWDHTPWRRA